MSRTSIRIAALTLAGAVGLTVLSESSTAEAQVIPPPILNGDGYDLHLFRPAVDTKGHFTVNGTDVLGHLQWAVGLTVDWGYGLARIGNRTTGTNDRPLVDHLFTGVITGNFGIANLLMVGIQLPIQLVFGPGDASLNVPGYAPQSTGMVFQGVGDFAVNLKFRYLPRIDRPPHIGLALLMQAAFPLMGGSKFFAGEAGISLWPRLLVEMRPGDGIFRASLELGYRHVFGTGSTLPQTAGSVASGSAITGALGLSLRVAKPLDIVVETYMNSYTAALFDPRATPWEAIGGLKFFISDKSYLMLGAGTRIPVGEALAGATVRSFIGIMYEPSIGDTDGDGFRDDVDKCPLKPEDKDDFEDNDGCPEPDNDLDGILDVVDSCPNRPEDRDGDSDEDGCPETNLHDSDGDGILDTEDGCVNEPEDRDDFQDTDGCPDPDNDQDGILDRVDMCANEPEDKDNWEDEDGCPDPDNDHDRILDEVDHCVNDPETYNGNQDDDGCPDQGEVVVEEGQIRILHAINFETSSARIKPDSVPIVEAVARTLTGHPEIELVEVQGHADERGDDAKNIQLTRERAAAVVDALVQRGVQRDRLHSAGYGARCRMGYPATPGQPEHNAVCQGLARNRGPRWCHSNRAWSLDRRVVFLILRTADGSTGVRVACDAGEDLIPEEDRAFHLNRGQ